MPDSTDGNNVRILADRDRQTSRHRVDQPKATADSTATNSFINELMHSSWSASAAVVAVLRPGGQLRSDVDRALGAAYEIMCHVRPGPSGGREPLSSDAGVGTRSTRASKSSIAALV